MFMSYPHQKLETDADWSRKTLPDSAGAQQPRFSLILGLGDITLDSPVNPGALTVVQNTAAVPEPSTWAMLGAGVGTMLLYRRRC